MQDRSLKHWGEEIVGWKVGGIPPHLRRELRQDWLAGPIFRNRTKYVDNRVVTMPIFEGGFGAVEAEIILEFGDVSELRNSTPNAVEIIPFIKNCYIGVEIASSPMPDINVLGPLAVISDFGNNNGMIVGRKIDPWSAKLLNAIEVTTYVEGQQVGVAHPPLPPGGPLGAAAFLVGNLRKRGLPIQEGLKVSSGALTGIHDVKVGDRSRVSFAGLGDIDIEIAAMFD